MISIIVLYGERTLTVLFHQNYRGFLDSNAFHEYVFSIKLRKYFKILSLSPPLPPPYNNTKGCFEYSLHITNPYRP